MTMSAERCQMTAQIEGNPSDFLTEVPVIFNCSKCSIKVERSFPFRSLSNISMLPAVIQEAKALLILKNCPYYGKAIGTQRR
ncbi:MAG: hypothetical protein V1808_00640 [Candidatus Daviesbacteria bacterium]